MYIIHHHPSLPIPKPAEAITSSNLGLGSSGAEPSPELYIAHKRDNPTLTIQCGSSGDFSDDCVVDGGHHHIWIDKVGKMVVKGITFMNADRGSVSLGTGNDYVTFQDCKWEHNVYTYKAERCVVHCAAVMSGQYGKVTLNNCQFIDNIGNTGAIFGQGGHVILDHCTFKGNKSKWKYNGYGTPTGSAVSLWNGGDLSVSNCCFLDNDSAGAGTISINELGGNIYLNHNNFFDDSNIARLVVENPLLYGNCPLGIYKYDWNDIDTCISGNASCCDSALGDAECPRFRRSKQTHLAVTPESLTESTPTSASPETAPAAETLADSVATMKHYSSLIVVAVTWLGQYLF